MNSLLKKIFQKIKKEPFKLQAYEDFYYVCIDDIKNNIDNLKLLSENIEKIIIFINDVIIANDMYELHKRVLLALAKYDFDSYMLYIEWERDYDKKFYAPRRSILRKVVKELQRLADDELDILAISLPPGVGKTTLAIFYLTWLAGKEPNKPMLTGSHSNSLYTILLFIINIL